MKCDLCGRKAVGKIEFLSKSLCEEHFVELFEKLFFDCLRRELEEVERIIGKEIEKIIVAVSGGKDSINTLYLTKKFVSLEGLNVDVEGLLIDEGIKGYRDKTIEFMKKVEIKLGVNVRVVSVKKEIGYSLDEIARKIGFEKACAACGIIRRYFLNKFAREMKGDVLVLGHNLDDEAQTIIMNFFQRNVERLSRLGEISGIVFSEKFIPRIKPMRYLREKESVIYSLIKGFYDFNRVECPYVLYSLRHRVRKGLNDILSKEFNPSIKINIIKFYDKVKYRLISNIKNKGISYCEKCGEPTTFNRNICKLCELLSLIKNG